MFKNQIYNHLLTFLKSSLRNVLLSLAFFVLLSSFAVYAQTPATPTSPSQNTETPAQNSYDPCKIAFCLNGIQNNKVYSDATLNPGQRAAVIISDVAFYLTTIVVSIAVIFIVFSGFQMLTANGDSGKYKTALNGIFYSISGMFVSVLAYGIVSSIISIIVKI